MPRRLYIETVGCQMNVLDSELVVGGLKRQGYDLAGDPEEADLLLYNTCSIREHAEEKVYSSLGTLRALKERRPEVVIGVLGCMAQKDQEGIFRRAPHVDLLCGPGSLDELPEMVEEVRRTRIPRASLSLGRRDAPRREVVQSFASFDPMRDPAMRPTPFQAFVRTQLGCDKFCTYCIVPSVRGPEQGRDPLAIVEECRVLADQGVVEVTLIGQTVNSYRFDHGDGRRTRLSDLLAAVQEIAGIERIRFVTNFPNDVTDDLLEAMRDLPKVCRHLHVPAQSGCDEVLARMKRHYSVAAYRERLARARETVPGISISGDLIVGFCGEGEASFERTRALVREEKFKNNFIYQYSPRPGTKAFDLPDDVPDETKRRRNNQLLADQNEASRADHRRFVGSRVEVLVEGQSPLARRGRPESANQLTGRTPTDHIVVFDGPPSLAGRIVPILVEDASVLTLFGRRAEAVDAESPPPARPPHAGRPLPVIAG